MAAEVVHPRDVVGVVRRRLTADVALPVRVALACELVHVAHEVCVPIGVGTQRAAADWESPAGAAAPEQAVVVNDGVLAVGQGLVPPRPDPAATLRGGVEPLCRGGQSPATPAAVLGRLVVRHTVRREVVPAFPTVAVGAILVADQDGRAVARPDAGRVLAHGGLSQGHAPLGRERPGASVGARRSADLHPVDHAVAVVVHAVAQFIRGQAGYRIAGGPRAIGEAGEHAARFAGAHTQGAGIAQVGEVLVGLTVAVVVCPVAELLDGEAGDGIADHLPVAADHEPFHLTCTDALGAGSLVRDVLVNGAVAVVVRVVAGLGCGEDLSVAGPPAHIPGHLLAHLPSAHAEADVETAVRAGVAVSLVAEHACAVEIFVDVAIAVVVRPVAVLGGGHASDGVADHLAVEAGETTLVVARADAVGARFPVGNAVVDGAVAVVVQVVAGLGCGVCVGDAAQRPLGAPEGTRATQTQQARVALESDPVDVVDLLVAVVVDVVAGLFRTRGDLVVLVVAVPLHLGQPVAVVVVGDGALVGGAVAVVVEAVGDLFGRVARSRTTGGPLPVLGADEHARAGASTDADVARRPQEGEAVVGDAVAVVVDVVAGLDHRLAPWVGALAADPAVCAAADRGLLIRAELCTRAVEFLNAGRRARVDEVLVDLAVAVVVDAVADFLGVLAVVHDPVAVVVDTIADVEERLAGDGVALHLSIHAGLTA